MYGCLPVVATITRDTQDKQLYGWNELSSCICRISSSWCR